MQIIRNQILVQLSDPHIRSATFKHKISGPLKPSLAFEDYMLAIITFSCKGWSVTTLLDSERKWKEKVFVGHSSTRGYCGPLRTHQQRTPRWADIWLGLVFWGDARAHWCWTSVITRCPRFYKEEHFGHVGHPRLSSKPKLKVTRGLGGVGKNLTNECGKWEKQVLAARETGRGSTQQSAKVFHSPVLCFRTSKEMDLPQNMMILGTLVRWALQTDLIHYQSRQQVREVFKNPSNGKIPLRGYLPPPPPLAGFGRPKS